MCQLLQHRAITLVRRAVRPAIVVAVILCLCATGAARASDSVCLPAAPAAHDMSRPPDQDRGWIGGLYHRVVHFAVRVKKASLKAMMMNRPDAPDSPPLMLPTDAERYRAATGRSLPAVHGLITLPPATPHGDYTYIWAASARESWR
jgi:hypothetical protein